MKKLVISIMLCLFFVVPSFAKEIDMYVPFNTSGFNGVFLNEYKKPFEDAGHTVNIIFAGDCATALSSYRNSKSPAILYWYTPFMTANPEGAICHYSEEEILNEYLMVVFSNIDMLCSTSGTNLFEDDRKEVVVGIRPDAQVAPGTKESLQANTTANLRFLPQRNSGALRTSIAAKEVDYFIHNGTSHVANNTATCHYSTGTNTNSPLTPITDVISDYPPADYVYFMSIRNANEIDVPALKEKLIDFTNSSELGEILERGGFLPATYKTYKDFL